MGLKCPPSLPAPEPAGSAVTKDASLPEAEWQVAEAKALVHTLDSWAVVETMVVPTKTPDSKLIFGKGTLEHLTGGSRALSLPLPPPPWRSSTHRLSLGRTEAASPGLGSEVHGAPGGS